MESLTISKNIENRDDRDFSFLQSEGLQHIQAMSRELWTDYNSHDPGITLLEALCYAITDLGNRINRPMPDLLQRSPENDEATDAEFPTAKKILTTAPVSENDYRKLFIDIEGVNNAFIRANTNHVLYRHCLQKDKSTEDDPQGIISYNDDLSPDYKKLDFFSLKGLYDIYFEPDYDIQLMDEESEERVSQIEAIAGKIKETYHVNRNLCEDLAGVAEISYLKILVCGDIEIARAADPAEVMAEILFRVKEYLSPSVRRFSLKNLLDENLPVENIFEGPVLQNGFIPDEELEKAAIKKEIHLSDLVQIVMKTPGVLDIRKLKMGLCGGDEILEEIRDKNQQKWKLCLPKDRLVLPTLCTESSIKNTNLYKDVIPVPANPDDVLAKLRARIQQHRDTLSLGYDDIPIEKGQYFDADYYRTVQNDLPQIYGTGEYGLSPSLPANRHAKAKQLKGYLLFFDQILATYFGHLRNIGDLLSAEVGSESYFATAVQDVANLDELLQDASTYTENVKKSLRDMDDFTGRKNHFLDHLLARFAENMNAYTFAMLEGFGQDVTGATLWHKSTLLKEYPEISYNRYQSFNYYAGESEAWNTDAVTGLEHRLARLLGIRDYSRRDLSVYDYDIYQEEDVDENDNEWRWRINDEDGNILFSGSMHYPSKAAAEREMWITVSLAWNPENYDLQLTGDEEQYYFNVFDANAEVVARHMRYFDSKEEARAQIDHLTEYMFSRVSDEGMFLFEHILFRPDRDDPEADQKFMGICMDPDCTQCRPADPYSFRLTIVFPGWIKRFSNLYFRQYAEQLIRREVPAHILCRICWIGNTAENEAEEESTSAGPMAQLENLYKKWLTGKMQHPDDQKENEFLKPLTDLLHDLETVYPQGRLYDCAASAEDESISSIILGKSTIGELKTESNGNE